MQFREDSMQTFVWGMWGMIAREQAEANRMLQSHMESL